MPLFQGKPVGCRFYFEDATESSPIWIYFYRFFLFQSIHTPLLGKSKQITAWRSSLHQRASILNCYLPPIQFTFSDTHTSHQDSPLTQTHDADAETASQAPTVPVRKIDAVGVSHSVPALPAIPSPSGLEKHSKDGAILPVATLIGSLYMNMPVSKATTFFQKQHRAPPNPLALGKNSPATLDRLLQRQRRPVPLVLKGRVGARVRRARVRRRLAGARRQAAAALAAGPAGGVDEVEGDAADAAGARAGGEGVEAGDGPLQGGGGWAGLAL